MLQTYPQQRYAFEFRHPSWLISQVYNLLERAGAALCLPPRPDVPLDTRLTAPWTYIRMHRVSLGLATVMQNYLLGQLIFLRF